MQQDSKKERGLITWVRNCLLMKNNIQQLGRLLQKGPDDDEGWFGQRVAAITANALERSRLYREERRLKHLQDVRTTNRLDVLRAFLSFEWKREGISDQWSDLFLFNQVTYKPFSPSDHWSNHRLVIFNICLNPFCYYEKLKALQIVFCSFSAF